MENIGFNNDVKVAGKVFHVQTEYMEPIGKVVSSVFEDGKLVMKKHVSMPAENGGTHIRSKTNELHLEMMEEIELMYYISDKVRTIRHAPSNYKLGVLFYNRNLYEEAIDEFKSAIAIEPDFAEAYLALGKSYLKANMLQQAKETLIEGLSKNDNFADMHFYLGYCCFLLNQPFDSIEALTKALEINPAYAAAQFWLSYVYLKTIVDDVHVDSFPSKIERLTAAKENLQKLLEIKSKFQTRHIKTALEKIEENDLPGVLSALDKAAQNFDAPADTEIENEFYLKFMFGGKGKDDEFILEYTHHLQQLIDQHQDYPDLHNQLGIAYLIQCRNLFLNALEEFRQAISLNPNFARAKKNLKLAENDGKGFLILLRAILK